MAQLATTNKEEWHRVYKTLSSRRCRVEDELAKGYNSIQFPYEPANAHNGVEGVYDKLAEAKLQLVELQKQVSEGQPTPTFIQALAARITSLTDFLNSLKSTQRQQYAALLQQEQQLLEELDALEAKSDSYEAAADGEYLQDDQVSTGQLSSRRSSTVNNELARRPSNASSSGSSSAARPASALASKHYARAVAGSGSTVLPEVAAHDNFLAKHGPTGGWHPDDHNTFLSILRSHRGDYSAALASVVDALPGMTRQAVIAHCRWHADLTDLDMRRRVALVNWRAARDAAKAARQAEAAALGDAQDQQHPAAPDQLEKEIKQMQKQLVEQWKLDKQKQQQQQVQQEADQQRQQQQQAQRRQQQHQAELKQRLQAAKAVKQEAAAAARRQAAAAQEAAQQAQLDSSQQQQVQQQEIQQRLQERNEATLQRRQQLIASRQDKLSARERLQQQILAGQVEKPHVERDPIRLLSATAAAAARAAAASAEAEQQKAGGAAARRPSDGGFILHLGHKAVPAWASGIR